MPVYRIVVIAIAYLIIKGILQNNGIS